MLLDNSRRYITFAAPTIISCFCDGALLKSLYKMAASLKDKRTPITTPQYQVPSVDVTPDPPIFSLVTTFNDNFYLGLSLFLHGSRGGRRGTTETATDQA
jgi:hypothetical protein